MTQSKPQQNENWSIVRTWIVFGFIMLAIYTVLVWDLSASWTAGNLESELQDQQHLQYAEDQIEQECSDLKGKPLRECIHLELATSAENAHALSDLVAQQQVAFFTKIMAATAIAGIILGGVSIWVVFSTLKEMGNTNRIMREDQRPWLVIDKRNGHFSWLGKAYRSTPENNMTIQVANKGRTPASDAIATFVTFSSDTMTAHDVSYIVEKNLPNIGDRKAVNRNTIFPGEQSNVQIVSMPPELRVIGNGREWTFMIICTYFWGDDIKHVWRHSSAKTPPKNVLRHRKIVNLH